MCSWFGSLVRHSFQITEVFWKARGVIVPPAQKYIQGWVQQFGERASLCCHQNFQRILVPSSARYIWSNSLQSGSVAEQAQKNLVTFGPSLFQPLSVLHAKLHWPNAVASYWLQEYKQASYPDWQPFPSKGSVQLSCQQSHCVHNVLRSS